MTYNVLKYGSFHFISKDAYYWIKSQPKVKEESITDRLIYQLNKNNPHVVCVEVTHNQEATYGLDWEWWLILNKQTYRFRVQAKKLKIEGKDNSPLLFYANSKGFQIETLIEQSERVKAIPLYAFYTDCEEQMSLNVVNIFFEPSRIVKNTCKECKNGIFLASAIDLQKRYLRAGRIKISSDELVQLSFPISMLDSLYFAGSALYYTQWKQLFPHYRRRTGNLYFDNDGIIKNILEDSLNSISEYSYSYEQYPTYLKKIINSRRGESEEIKALNTDEFTYILSEYKELEKLNGIGVIDVSDTMRIDFNDYFAPREHPGRFSEHPDRA